MARKNLLLLSLGDSRIKGISNVIGNESCRKILDYLSDKESTESELAKNLGIPISTVHYNLDQLMKSGLIISEEFHYSKKGREVDHFKLANKYIIIAPKNTKFTGITQKLKNILPVALIVGGTALIVQYIQKFLKIGGTTRIFTDTKQTLIRETIIPQKAAELAPIAEGVAASAKGGAIQQAVQSAPIAQDAVLLSKQVLHKISSKNL